MDQNISMSILAAELVGIYRDARTTEDEEFAADAIDDLLDEIDDDTDDEVLVALLDLPETELTAPLVEDAVCMLADAGADMVERLLLLGLENGDPISDRARDALDRMDDDQLADGLFEILAGDGTDQLRRLAAAALVALGHAGAARLQEAFDDPWTRDLAEAAVAERGTRPCDDGGPAAPLRDERRGEREGAGESDDETHDAADQSEDESPSEPEPVHPPDDGLEAEYRAFLERFERERDG
jgi:hypothetical protein